VDPYSESRATRRFHERFWRRTREVNPARTDTDPHQALALLVDLAGEARSREEVGLIAVEFFEPFVSTHGEAVLPELEVALEQHAGLRGVLMVSWSYELDGPVRDVLDHYRYWTPPRSMR
jgi:hypothetical protein